MSLSKYIPSNQMFQHEVQRLFNEDAQENPAILESSPIDLIRYFDQAEENLKTNETYIARLEIEKLGNFICGTDDKSLDDMTDDEKYELVDKIKTLGSDPETMYDTAFNHGITMWEQVDTMTCIDLMEQIEE